MKKIFLALMAVTAIAIVGCDRSAKNVNELEPPENKEQVKHIEPPTEDSTVITDHGGVPDDGK